MGPLNTPSPTLLHHISEEDLECDSFGAIKRSPELEMLEEHLFGVDLCAAFGPQQNTLT